MLNELQGEFKGLSCPPLGGYVYRFTIYLPLLSEGREVFSSHQRALLHRLFHACFAGYTERPPKAILPGMALGRRQEARGLSLIVIRRLAGSVVPAHLLRRHLDSHLIS